MKLQEFLKLDKYGSGLFHKASIPTKSLEFNFVHINQTKIGNSRGNVSCQIKSMYRMQGKLSNDPFPVRLKPMLGLLNKHYNIQLHYFVNLLAKHLKINKMSFFLIS